MTQFRKIPRFGNTLKTYKDTCFYCGTHLEEYSRDVDHLIPKSKGGIKSNDNKVFSCVKCNRLKDNMTPQEFVVFLESAIRLEKMDTTIKVGYLKKVKQKVQKMIETKKWKRNEINVLEKKGSAAS